MNCLACLTGTKPGRKRWNPYESGHRNVPPWQNTQYVASFMSGEKLSLMPTLFSDPLPRLPPPPGPISVPGSSLVLTLILRLLEGRKILRNLALVSQPTSDLQISEKRLIRVFQFVVLEVAKKDPKKDAISAPTKKLVKDNVTRFDQAPEMKDLKTDTQVLQAISDLVAKSTVAAKKQPDDHPTSRSMLRFPRTTSEPTLVVPTRLQDTSLPGPWTSTKAAPDPVMGIPSKKKEHGPHVIRQGGAPTAKPTTITENKSARETCPWSQSTTEVDSTSSKTSSRDPEVLGTW
ncbi:MAG: hypothetical protein M1817_006372 [Caeruleum heppii]|nr:MAG: hypothetical protein M1817_006372 [Caeruleum heppii]